MADSTEAIVKARFEALYALIPGITTVLTGTEQSIPASALPAVEIRIGAATRRKLNANSWMITRDFEAWLFVVEIRKSESYAIENAALEACYPFLYTIADFFLDHSRLEMSDAGLVHMTGDIRDSGPQRTPFKDTKEYATVRLVHPTTFRRT